MVNILGQRDLVIYLAALLNKKKIKYLLTGSLAVSYYGYPRATHDIDFVVEIQKHDSKKILKVFKNIPASFLIDHTQIKDSIENSSQFNIYHPDTGIKIDFWVIGVNKFEQNKFKRKKTILIDKQKVDIVSAEDLILTKLLWCKTIKSERHLRDCTGIIQIQKNKLNKEYLETWTNKLELKDLFNEVSSQKYY